MESAIIYPKPLRQGDSIAIVSPAGIVRREFVEQSVDVLMQQGWNARIGKSALGKNGTFSGTVEERVADMRAALLDPTIRAIICSRGGYGCVHLLPHLADIDLTADPKWLVGFSDVTALHALMQSQGVASLHASMTKHLAAHSGNDHCSQMLFDILRGGRPQYEWESHQYNRCGHAAGQLVGGNFAVMQALVGTSYDIIRPDTILFIEDISEPIYKVERMLWQLKLSGVLGSLRALIFGQFTNYQPDANHPDMETMIHNLLADIDIPTAFNAPIGHISANYPIIEGAIAALTITPTGVTLKME